MSQNLPLLNFHYGLSRLKENMEKAERENRADDDNDILAEQESEQWLDEYNEYHEREPEEDET